MIKKFIAAIAISSMAMVAAPAVASAVEPSVAVSKASDYSKKKKEKFWKVAKSIDPTVVYGGKANAIALGVSTCDLLRSGADMEDLVMLVIEADAGEAEDALVAVIATAPAVLCPDQQYKFD